MKRYVVYLSLLAVAVFMSCGKQDARNGNCVLYGDECHDVDDEQVKKDNEVGTSTSTPGPRGAKGEDGDDCEIETTPDGPVITCGDNSVLVPKGLDGNDGADGQNGQDGTDGQDGYSLVFAILNTSSCSNGGKTILIARDLNRDNALDPLLDDNLQSTEICNGLDGQDGEDGEDAPPSSFTPVAVVDPCGDKPGIFDEVFLRLYNGQLLWSLSDNANGKNTRFSLAVPGNWITTDGSECHFSIDNNFNLYNEHY